MAERSLQDVQIVGKDRVLVNFSFAPNGTSAVSAASNKGQGVTSVTRNSAGKFTLLLDDTWGQLDSATGTLQLATAADQFVQIGTYTAASKTLVVRIWDVSGAGVADVAANANNRVNLKLVFRNTANEN